LIEMQVLELFGAGMNAQPLPDRDSPLAFIVADANRGGAVPSLAAQDDTRQSFVVL
jgi:hypothetical protein